MTEAQSTGWTRVATRIRVPLGFVFAVVYLGLAHPTRTSIVAGALILACGLALRAFASGHVRKNTELTTTGPYAYTRNPLYLGSIIMAAGFALAARHLWLALAMLLMFVAIYLPVIRSEEAFLRARFAEFEDYARRVPRLLPRFSPAGPSGTFSRELYLKHREYNALLGAIVMLAVLVGKLVWSSR